MEDEILTRKQKKDIVHEQNRNAHTSCGQINGHIKNTESYISIGTIELKLDKETAWALCNRLSESALKDLGGGYVDADQIEKLRSLGGVIGRFISHPSANNGKSAFV